MTTPTSGLPPANWYPDPQTPGQLRYWDGQKWTQHVHPAQQVQQQAPGAAAAAVAGAVEPGTAQPAGTLRPGGAPQSGGTPQLGLSTPGPGTGSIATFQPGARPGTVQTPRTPDPGADYSSSDDGDDPHSLRHWLVPTGRSTQAIAAGAVALLVIIVTAASIYGFDPKYDQYLTYVAAGLSFLAVLLGFGGLQQANASGYHGKGRSWFAIGVGFLGLLLNAWEIIYPDELLDIFRSYFGS